jgi:hypothetical protein
MTAITIFMFLAPVRWARRDYLDVGASLYEIERKREHAPTDRRDTRDVPTRRARGKGMKTL